MSGFWGKDSYHEGLKAYLAGLRQTSFRIAYTELQQNRF